MDPWKNEILNNLLSRVIAVKKAKHRKLIFLNVPQNSFEKVKVLLPGIMNAASLPATDEGWTQIQVVINENDFWKVVADLKALGAMDILMIPIEKIID